MLLPKDLSLHGFAAHHGHLDAIVLRQAQDLVLSTPVELVSDPRGVLVHAVEAQQEAAGGRI